GLDEVILPHPLRISQPRVEAPQRSGTPDVQGDPTIGQAAGPSLPVQAGLSGPPGGDTLESGLSPLFQSLSHALDEAGGSARDKAATEARKSPRPKESMHFPVFQGLADYWEYLDKFPGVLQAGEDAAPGLKVVRATGPASAPLAL